MLRAYEVHLVATGKAPSTVKNYLQKIDQLQRVFPELLEVTLSDLEFFIFGRQEQSAEARKNFRTAFKSFYDWAHKRNLIPENPTADLESIAIPSTTVKVADDDALQLALIGAPLIDQFMILAGRHGMLRLSEIAALEMRQRSGAMFRVKGKGAKIRNVPINDDWMPVVLELERALPRGYYLPGLTNGHVHISTVYRHILLRTGYNPHALRHRGATAALEGGADIKALQETLGHASLATTEKYLHTSVERIRLVGQSNQFSSRPVNPHAVDVDWAARRAVA